MTAFYARLLRSQPLRNLPSNHVPILCGLARPPQSATARARQLLGLLREGDTVLVARFFRLGCRRDHMLHLSNSFHQRGIHFKALNIDTTASASNFMLSVFASLTEYDR